ncbi:MAG: anhydro-N-acetylmuramic acid kinase, partial [Gammaproteobacteria bacterium]|nr:anhydro-N-acetylmuramic acid kinase [Gammaproteobacteria bacterium]
MSKLFIGLMSGTSLDGVDAALIEFSNEKAEIKEALTLPFPDNLREAIRSICDHPQQHLDSVGELDIELGELFAKAAQKLLAETSTDADKITAIGSHGQTIRHRPDHQTPFTWQIGDPNIIVARTGITVVADFRRRDVALGGQGAPMVPAFHRAQFAAPDERRVVVNIGGIANISLLDGMESVSGYDTGPGNVLMNEWI